MSRGRSDQGTYRSGYWISEVVQMVGLFECALLLLLLSLSGGHTFGCSSAACS